MRLAHACELPEDLLQAKGDEQEEGGCLTSSIIMTSSSERYSTLCLSVVCLKQPW